MTGALEVLAPGVLTTVQDLGRGGYRALGIPASGALDPFSLQLANALVGNHPEIGALEIRAQGPTLKVKANSVAVALSGTSASIEILTPARRLIPPDTSVVLLRDQQFRVGAVADSSCCYLALSGGLDLPLFYGSQSTYLAGKLGGWRGRALGVSDLLPLNLSELRAYQPRALRRATEPDATGPIRVVLGPQTDYFSTSCIQRFLSSNYALSPQSNRMGAKLEGPKLSHLKGFNIASDAVIPGSIQVPGDGSPIVLLADCQSTGGYPKIATVISADLPRLARKLPREPFTFVAVEVEAAEAAARTARQQLNAALESLGART